MLMTLNLLDAVEAVDVEVNSEKSKYIFIYRHKNVGKNHILKTGNRYFETVTKLQS
jgi:hypothetical protein